MSQGDSVPVKVTGTIGSDPFIGTDYIHVNRSVVSAPLAGSHVAAGSVTKVRWQTPGGATIESVALLHSLDGGGTWSLIARDLPSTGSYDWTVPAVATDHANIAVVLIASAHETDYIVESVLGVSGPFSIDALVGVGDRGPIQFALRGATPNPAQHKLRVSFSLRDSKAATLVLFDVSGRQVAARRLDGMGAGSHTVELGGRSKLPPGFYVIRLSQGGLGLTTRAVIAP